MGVARRTFSKLGLVVGILATTAGAAHAQAPRVSPAVAARAEREPVARDLRVPRVDLFELSRYAGWGGAIGACLGLTYAHVLRRGTPGALVAAGDAVVGFTIGLVAGTAVYVVKLALGR
jgi:hypothetical protein